MTHPKSAIEQAVAALELCEDELARSPHSTGMWANGTHPNTGITIVREALDALRASTGMRTAEEWATEIVESGCFTEDAEDHNLQNKFIKRIQAAALATQPEARPLREIIKCDGKRRYYWTLNEALGEKDALQICNIYEDDTLEFWEMQGHTLDLPAIEIEVPVFAANAGKENP